MCLPACFSPQPHGSPLSRARRALLHICDIGTVDMMDHGRTFFDLPRSPLSENAKVRRSGMLDPLRIERRACRCAHRHHPLAGRSLEQPGVPGRAPHRRSRDIPRAARLGACHRELYHRAGANVEDQTIQQGVRRGDAGGALRGAVRRIRRNRGCRTVSADRPTYNADSRTVRLLRRYDALNRGTHGEPSMARVQASCSNSPLPLRAANGHRQKRRQGVSAASTLQPRAVAPRDRSRKTTAHAVKDVVALPIFGMLSESL